MLFPRAGTARGPKAEPCLLYPLQVTFPNPLHRCTAEVGEGTGSQKPRDGTHVDVAVEHGLEVLRNYFGYLVNQTHQEAAHGIVS